MYPTTEKSEDKSHLNLCRSTFKCQPYTKLYFQDIGCNLPSSDLAKTPSLPTVTCSPVFKNVFSLSSLTALKVW